jgi:hypothetical protein
MTFLNPLARSIERFVYEGICALSGLAPADRTHATGVDSLASPLDGNELHPRLG